MKGWGEGACDDQSTGGNWSDKESGFHINYLELLAAWFALKSFAKVKSDIHIKMCIDNTTALAYIGNMGGKLPALNELARKIWLWCIDKNIWLSVAYIESENNVEADNESRLNHDNLEWNLNRTLFDEITKLFYMPDIDIFASRLNNQVELENQSMESHRISPR